MEIPRFETPHINPRLILADIGDAFQTLVHELLSFERPQLHRFPGGGKDGGIDLIESSDSCFVVECKVVSDDDYSLIKQRWNKVKEHLEEHLSDPEGPTKGQSQYGPWYSKNTPIDEYAFCVSATFANEQQRRDLRNVITDYFHNLANRRPHLSHLGSLKVSIIDWNDLSTRLQKRPHTIFRWFPRSRPNGLIPLDKETDVGTFRSYLFNPKLPYHSLSEHLRMVPAPEGTTIQNEECLLNQLEQQSITGLVITGKGGVGKSRLMLEVGFLAQKQGWTVMRVQGRLKDDALEDLTEHLTPENPALLLIDYIETQTDFGELIERLNLLNDSGVARIRFVAACRTGSYQVITVTSRHLRVDLSPPPGDAVIGWYAKYRSEIVRRILVGVGIVVIEQHIAVCRDLPILAVFMAFLHTTSRAQDLAELLSGVDFGQWVTKRIQLTFSGRNVSRDLALLIPLFPMADSLVIKLHPEHHRAIFDRLATDGWIERIRASAPDAPDEWVTAHDVLADQVLLSFLRDVPYTADTYVAELLSLATKHGCISSAIISLQRVADSAPLNVLPWAKIIVDAIATNEDAWRNTRGLLVRTSLLSVPERIALLYTQRALWTDADQDIDFQNALGWFARWLLSNADKSIPEPHKQNLIVWICNVARFAERSNFVITWGLRLSPETVQDTALEWISSRPTLFQTHYLLVAWLECHLPIESVSPIVQRWCQKYAESSHLSFVAKAWLHASGNTELVRDVIDIWLGKHKTDMGAEYVYKAWLDARGDKDLVKEAITAWLDEHKTHIGAGYVFNAWLDAEGDKGLVREAIRAWLREHGTIAEASHVYKAWLDAKGDKSLVQDAISAWLGEHKTDATSEFVFNAWLDSGGDTDLVRDAISAWLGIYEADAEAKYVYNAWLDAGGETGLVREAIGTWVGIHGNVAEASHVYKAWLDAKGDKDLVQEAIRAWLIGHKTDLEASFIYKAWLVSGGSRDLVQDAIGAWLAKHGSIADADYVYKAWLDSGGDRLVVREALTKWMAAHESDENVDFVCSAWLKAKGEFCVVWNALLTWFTKHRTEQSAGYAARFITRQPDLSASTVKDLLVWCRTFPDLDDALWRLTKIGKNLLIPGIQEEVVITSEAVLARLLFPNNDISIEMRGHVTTLISYLLTLSKSVPQPLQFKVLFLFAKWLRHPLSFETDPKPRPKTQRVSFVLRLQLLINAHVIDIVGDHDIIGRFLAWVNKWDIERKMQAIPTLNYLRRRYPASDLWDIVHFRAKSKGIREAHTDLRIDLDQGSDHRSLSKQ